MTPRATTTKINIDGPSGRWHGREPLGRLLPDGSAEPGRPLIVLCTHREGAGLCPGCVDLARLVLADVPALFGQLEICATRQTRFVAHGSLPGSESPTGDTESPLPYVPAGTYAARRLRAALDRARPYVAAATPDALPGALGRALDALADTPAIVDIVRDVTSAAARAAHVIDAPPNPVYYGPCPECGADIWRERVERLAHSSADPDAVVACPRCDYRARLDDHYQDLLAAGEDAWLTVPELMSAITLAGESVTRHQIHWWIKRGGLACEKRSRPRWRNGELIVNLANTYRLGDVRQRALESEIRRGRKAG